MKFIIDEDVFKKLPNVCFGVVIAKNIDNSIALQDISALLDTNIIDAYNRFYEKKIKEHEQIVPYRNSFAQIGINPNKFLCSIEALFTRISKGKGLPHINPIVDLGNAISLKYTLPIGAHDISNTNTNICLRFSTAQDHFTPIGSSETETLDIGELIYVTGHQVRTRRWTWRQSDIGKITNDSSCIFFPIDGFTDINKENILKARDELAKQLIDTFNCEVEIGFIDSSNMEMNFMVS
jgi:DNA/RNA-binding domain of Phe-tRNA-synthetase-like protein